MAGGDDAFGDGGDLFRRLPRPEDDLRTTLPQCAMVVDAGEAKILERGLAQILKQLVWATSGVRAPERTSLRRLRSSARVIYLTALTLEPPQH